MKTKSILIAALFVVGSIITSVAGDEPGSKGFAVLTTKSAGIFKVIYKTDVARKVKLNLYDAQSSLIYSESFVAGFILPLNLQGLSYGEYTLEIVDGTGKRTEKISYQAAVDSKYFSVRKVGTAKDKFLLSVSGANQSEKINIRIYDAYNNVVYSEVKEVSGQFSQVYFLKNSNGPVTFEVSDNFGKASTLTF